MVVCISEGSCTARFFPAIVFLLVQLAHSTIVHIPRRNALESNEKTCLRFGAPIDILWGSVDPFSNPIPPLLFRANNYGAAKYDLESSYQGQPILNFKMEDGPRPDTVRGGDLNGFYAFYRSFLVPHNIETSQIKLSDVPRPAFEIWNVYLLKNATSKKSIPKPVISLNVFLQIGQPNAVFHPIISTIQKLELNSSTRLPITFDPYRLLPTQGYFALYETSIFPFKYPEPLKTNTASNSQCKSLIKVYLYGNQLAISQDQVNKLFKFSPGAQTHTKSTDEVSSSNLVHPPPRIFYTNSQHMIFRRMVGDDAVGDDYYDEPVTENYVNDKEELPKPGDELKKYNLTNLTPDEAGDDEGEYFPPDCSFLYRVKNTLKNPKRSAAASVAAAPAALIVVVVLRMRICNPCF